MRQEASESAKVDRHCEKAYLALVFLQSSLADLTSAREGAAFGVCLWDKDSLDLRPGFACMYSLLGLEFLAQAVMSKNCTNRACFCAEQLAAHSCVLAPASTKTSTISTCPCARYRLFSADLGQQSGLYKAGKVTSSQARCKAVLPCAFCRSGILSCTTPKN